MSNSADPVLEYATPHRSGSFLGHSVFALILSILGAAVFPLPLCAFWIARSILKQCDEIEPRTRSLASAARIISFFTTPISMLILVVFVALPRLDGNRPVGRLGCSSNMRQIGLAMKIYANEHGDCYPPDLPTLLRNEELAADSFICPSSDDEVDRSANPPNPMTVIPGTAHCSYIYFADPPLRDSTVSPDRIMLIEPLSNHNSEGINVLYADDHVDWMDKKEAVRVMTQLLIGHNPPWPATSQPSTQP